MLKLEKSTSHGISLTYRQQRSLPRSFWIAFGIALALHLFALILFNIKLFKLIDSQTLFEPVVVITDPLSAASWVTSMEEVQELNTATLEPPKTELKIPDLPDHPFKTHLDERIYNLNKQDPFVKTQSPLLDLNLDGTFLKSSKASVAIVLSGPLANRTVLNTKLNQPPAQFTDNQLIRFKVKLDEKSGMIFWQERVLSSENKEFNKLAETIVHDLQLTTLPDRFVTSGEIEIQFIHERIIP